MYAVDINITFTFTILKHDTPPANIDLVLVDPTGITIFDEAGSANSAVYVVPDTNNNGSYTFSKIFTVPGRWEIILGDGVESNYTQLYSRTLTIQQSATTYVASFNLLV